MTLKFDYWNNVDPKTFLIGDWENTSRQWAGDQVRALVEVGCVTMAEVGPGAGVDYARQFKPLVTASKLSYTGFEGSSGLFANLQASHPEASWQNASLLALPPKAFDIVYARHVLEHQPSFEPSFSTLLVAARKAVIIVWYRPPSDRTLCEVGPDGCYYCTYERATTLAVVQQSGWRLQEAPNLPPDGNLGWVLTP